jgi:DNA topoisomerase-1
MGPFIACTGYPKCKFTRNYSRDEKGDIKIEEPAQEKPTDEVCDKCGSPMVQKTGRFGPFLACSSYPDCKNTRSLKSKDTSKPEPTGVKCPEEGCDGELVQRRSKRGKVFYGCNRYPKCSFAVWNKPVPQACPECDAPIVVEHTTKKDGRHLKCHKKECAYKEPLPENSE